MIQVHRDLERLPRFIKAVITIGTFDGVHLGHQQIIEQLKQEASEIGGETVIITFHPHPRKVVATERSEIQLLNTLDEKIALLNSKGINHVVIVPFDASFSNQSPEDYIANFLVKKFHPHTVIIGYDHKFGKDRTGDYHLLEALASQFNYKVKEIPEHVLQEVVISSTRIREALLNNGVATANTLLGYDFFFTGKVVEGDKKGRTIGYPTANLHVEDDEKLVPGNGVYAVELLLNKQDSMFKGMMNIGFRPTVNGTKKTIEVNIFDLDENIYNHYMQVHVKHYLRGEIKFNSLEELKQQLATDRANAMDKLAV